MLVWLWRCRQSTEQRGREVEAADAASVARLVRGLPVFRCGIGWERVTRLCVDVAVVMACVVVVGGIRRLRV